MAKALKLRDVEATAAGLELYPAWPGQVSKMKAWIHDVELLKQALSDLRLRYQSVSGDPADQLLQDTLPRLVGGIAALVEPETGELEKVREHLSWAESLHERSITMYADQWKKARESINKAMDIGAFHYIRKDTPISEIKTILLEAWEEYQLEQDN